MAPNWLGDTVMALPAIADIRRRFPSTRLVVAARRAVADLFRLVPFVDELVTLQWSGRWWHRHALAADAARLQEVGAETAILLPNSFATGMAGQARGHPGPMGLCVGYARAAAVPRGAAAEREPAPGRLLSASDA